MGTIQVVNSRRHRVIVNMDDETSLDYDNKFKYRSSSG